MEELTEEPAEPAERVAALDIGKPGGAACGCRTSPGWERAAEESAPTAPSRPGAAGCQELLVCQGVTRVVMEATSAYWKPLLPARRRRRALGGQRPRRQERACWRKTDKLDASWPAKLAECGMLRPSFIPGRRSGSCGT